MRSTENAITREHARGCDNRAFQEYGLPGTILMENAGRSCAEILLQQDIDGPVVICCGKGNNGGDGFVIARHLICHDIDVRILLFCPESQVQGDARLHFDVARKCHLPFHDFSAEALDREALEAHLQSASWIVDALLGTGMKGSPRPPLDEVINEINRSHARVMSVDIPSGMDCDTGLSAGPTVEADITVTFVARKVGFQRPKAEESVGRLLISDIGIPGRLLID